MLSTIAPSAQPQTIAPSAPVQTIAPAFIHLATLINRATGDEQSIYVYTATDRFTDVLREMQRVREAEGLTGYDLAEPMIELTASVPF